MSTSRAYRTRHRKQRPQQTRERITSAVRELLAEGTFHEATVEEVADRAGISRATLYQHFGSRLELVDAICDTFDENPALLALRKSVQLADADAALAETIANAVGFWSSEDPILSQLYGVAAIDPAAQDLVERQRADRRREMERLAKRLRTAGRLRSGVTERQAVARLMILTSYGTYGELREAKLAPGKVTTTLQDTARALLLA
jgi:AcrR family transcriptional regulator